VPSLSKTASRSAGGTNVADRSSVTASTKAVIACRVAVSFHDARCSVAPVIRARSVRSLRVTPHHPAEVSHDTVESAAATANPSTVMSPEMSPPLRTASGIRESISITRSAPAANPSTAALRLPDTLSAIP
jgi:hypothetical protein